MEMETWWWSNGDGRSRGGDRWWWLACCSGGSLGQGMCLRFLGFFSDFSSSFCFFLVDECGRERGKRKTKGSGTDHRL